MTELEFTTAFAELEDHAPVRRVRWPQGGATGDRVNQYMPMVPGAIVDLLACARIGAIHSVVFGGLAASELADRTIADTLLLDGTREIATRTSGLCVIQQRNYLRTELIGSRDLDWHDFQDGAASADCVAVGGAILVISCRPRRGPRASQRASCATPEGIWCQTETGYAIVGNPVGIAPEPVKLGSPTLPMPEYDVHMLAEDGFEAEIVRNV